MGENSQLDAAVLRQAVMDWRDRQILAAASLLNRSIIDARTGLDTELDEATAGDALFNPVRFANRRIDERMNSALRPRMDLFIEEAASELSGLDPRLAVTAQALTSAELNWPQSDGQPISAPDQPVETREPGERSPSPLDLLARVGRSAGDLANSAGAATDSVVNQRLGMIARIRQAVDRRIETAWMNVADRPDTLLFQLVDLIDRTCHDARSRLS